LLRQKPIYQSGTTASFLRKIRFVIYFADPYASWQRGTNANTSGLIRQYLPKSRNLGTLNGGEIRMIENRINNRPRKCNGYLTPNEVAYNKREKLTVSLRS